MKSSTKDNGDQKQYSKMTTAELAEATKEFDREFVAETFRPLTPAEHVKWERLKRATPGRPKVGEGVQVVSVSIEKQLLRSADRLAKRRKVSRASLIAEGLRALLASSTSRPATKRAASPKKAQGAKRELKKKAA